MNKKIEYEKIEVGFTLPELVKKPTYVQLFRYSAITWNSHRIHYDQAYASEEGYPDILVQSHMHGAFLTQVCTDWIGISGRIKQFDIKVKKYATPEDVLTCKGEIIEKIREEDEELLVVKLSEVNQKGELCASGTAIISLSTPNLQ